MNLEEYRNYCLSLPHATEGFPFDSSTLVFSVAKKIFVFVDADRFQNISLKADPEVSTEMKERYPAVRPGFHLNKKHWITIDLDGSIDRRQIFEWTKDSYELVWSKLPRSVKLNFES